MFLSFLNHEFDVLAFCETLYGSSSDVVSISRYNCEALYREDKRGGGIALYIKKSFVYDIVLHFSAMLPSRETPSIKTRYFVLGVVYCPPSGFMEEFSVSWNPYCMMFRFKCRL